MGVIQIAGNNGTGKTTIIRQLMALSPNSSVHSLDGLRKAYTLLHDVQYAVVGYYPPTAQSGGCDNLHNMQEIRDVLTYLTHHYRDWNIVFEGVMISMSMTTYNFIMNLPAPAFIVVLTSNLDTCHARIVRRTGKSLKKWDLFEHKHRQMERNLRKYASGTFAHLQTDTISEKDMLRKFLIAIGDDALLELLYGSVTTN